MIEAEHVGFYNPFARRHAIEAERTIIVSESYQATFALRGANRCSGDGLATCFYGARLGYSSGFKNKWQAHRQKHENFEH